MDARETRRRQANCWYTEALQPSSRHFAHETRVLVCDNCGAPLQAEAQGGPSRCRYCDALNQIALRVDLRALTATESSTLDEDERLARLRAQVGRTNEPPATMVALLEGAKILPWKAEEAWVAWRSSRERALRGDLAAADETLFLALTLVRTFDGQPGRQRALLESSLEAVTLPRQRQLLLCALAMGAATEADADAAGHWLSFCNPRVDDLAADSAYRIARALVLTLGRKPAEVLETLGREDARVPLATDCTPLAAVLRANACFTLGDLAATDAALTSVESSLLKEEVVRFGAVLDPALSARLDRAHHKLGGCMAVAGSALLLLGATAFVWLGDSTRDSAVAAVAAAGAIIAAAFGALLIAFGIRSWIEARRLRS